MTEQQITQFARELIRLYSLGWLSGHLNITTPDLSRRIKTNTWLTDQATVIRRYHEMLVETHT